MEQSKYQHQAPPPPELAPLEVTEQEADLIRRIRALGHGELTIDVQHGRPWCIVRGVERAKLGT